MEADRTTISGILDRLERIGLVERKISPKDRRSSVLFVTEKGKRLQEKLGNLAADFNASLTESLTKGEADELIKKLKKIRSSLS